MTRRHRCRSSHVSLHNQPWKFWKTISTPFFTKAQVVFHTSIIFKKSMSVQKSGFMDFWWFRLQSLQPFFVPPLFRGRKTPSSPIPVAPRDVRHIVITQVDDARTHPAWIEKGMKNLPTMGGEKMVIYHAWNAKCPIFFRQLYP